MKKKISTLLTAILLIGSIQVSAAPVLTDSKFGETVDTQEEHITQTTKPVLVESFSDVPHSFWGYDSIMAMTRLGYFAGKGEIVNGVGTFAPEDTMTKAEFLTVTARILYADEAETYAAQSGGEWWSGYYKICLERGVINESEFSESNMSEPMTRQEMALVSIRALQLRGESMGTVHQSAIQRSIPDYQSIGTYYRDSVVKSYSKGILCGTDDIGTFNPQLDLTRAEATTVLYRIIENSARTPIKVTESSGTGVVNPDVSVPSDWPTEWAQMGYNYANPTDYYAVRTPSQGPITIKEGEVGKRPFAREGDTVIKADGTSVVLKIGPNGILGEGQGVAPDLGVVTVTHNMEWEVTAKNVTTLSYTGKTPHTNSAGVSVCNDAYYVNQLTGEGHWISEWQVMTTKPTNAGSKDMQLSSDYNWYWDAGMNEWCAVYVQNLGTNGAQMLKDANGL